MKLWYLAFRNMISKPLNLVLSLLLLVLSVSLVTFVLQLSQQLNGQLDKNIAPVDMVVGAKGSPLQLVLSSVLHIDTPTGNINLNEARLIMEHPFVGTAIPVSYGDNYKGYRILGTDSVYFQSYNAVMAEGRIFERAFEVVAGYGVAQKLGLKVGDVFTSSHGLATASGEEHDEHPFKVVGLLKPTGAVIDQLLVCNLESVWDAHDHGNEAHGHEDDEHDHEEEGHVHEDSEHEHEDEEHEHGDDEHEHGDGEHELKEEENQQRKDRQGDELEITSLLVKFKSPLGLVQLPPFINENTNMQAALPGFEIQRLMGLLGSGVKTINGIAIAILLVSGFSIFISLLKTIRERRHELALLRTYGLGVRKLLYLVLLEGLFLAFFGFFFGWLIGRVALVVASGFIESGYGYDLEIKGLDAGELVLFGATLAIAVVAVTLASTSIFKMNISKILSDE